MYHILIVEDDESLNQGIAFALREEENRFYQAGSVAEAEQIWREKEVDMILLDINLPDGSGYDFLKRLRKSSQIPVLMITANDLESHEVTGFALGADDYITKPFGLMALRARVARMKERTAGKRLENSYEDDRYCFRFDRMQFLADGEEINLSKTEQKLLRCLVEHPGQTLTREQLTDIIWAEGAQYVDENALSVAVGRLRHKLEGNKGTSPIETIYGIGYMWGKKI